MSKSISEPKTTEACYLVGGSKELTTCKNWKYSVFKPGRTQILGLTTQNSGSSRHVVIVLFESAKELECSPGGGTDASE